MENHLVFFSPPVPVMPSTQGAVKVKPKVCKLCPGHPEFATNRERNQHKNTIHSQQCPKCFIIIRTKRFPRHLLRVHGVTDGVVANQTTPDPIGHSAPAEPSHVAYTYVSNLRADAPSWDSKNSNISHVYDTPLERFYCEEYDCGKGFSSKGFLESHTKFFHSKNATQTTGGEKGITTSSINPPEASRQSTNHPLVYFSPASTANSSLPEERTMWAGPNPPGPVLPPKGYRATDLNIGNGVQRASGSFLEPPTAAKDKIKATPAVNTSTPLSLQCMVCNAAPTVGTRPTVTMCGHIFCSECITRHVMSTPSCPVCDNALLLYCLFKLDLPALL